MCPDPIPAGRPRPACIVILNWNGWKDTVECVESCRRQTYGNYRILIVDNGSSDGSERILRERFPQTELLQTGRNLGYAGGNNAGIRHALAQGAEYIWLLNNDTVADPGALAALVRAIETEPRAGIVGSKIYYHDQPDVIWFAGGRIDFRAGTTSHIGQFEKDTGRYDLLADVDYITGCSLMIGAGAIARAGLMDERFFLLYEETDWNRRVVETGGRLLYVPDSRVWHKISRSIGESSPTYNYYLFRNCLLFTAKHRPGLLIPVLWRKLREIVSFHRRRETASARYALRGVIHFLLRRFGPMR